MSRLLDDFRAHLCQTSDGPLRLEIVSAGGATIVDREGREYVDLLAGMGVANVGHGREEVVEAIRDQAGRYLHAMVYGEYVQEPQVRYATALAERLPAPIDCIYFTNSGAEAIEGAIKTARKHTGRSGLVAFEGSFHGDTTGALALGGNPVYREPFEPLLPDVRVLPFDDESALDAIDEDVAAVFIEPVQAEGGVRVPQPAFLRALRDRCTAVGALLVYDEVVTAFGRTGRLFGYEHAGAVPDIFVLAKALGGGMPLGAFAASKATLATLSHDPPLGHVTTFGGHPVSCAAGLAALEILERESLAARAASFGAEFESQLSGLPWKGRLREIRRAGLLIGLELDSADATRRFAERSFTEGVVLNWTLHRDRVVRLAPPLSISEDEAALALSRLAAALA